MCLQCRFTDLHEYACHITRIINKGKCQLPLGNQETCVRGWVLKMSSWCFAAIKGVLTSPYIWRGTSRTNSIPTANIQRRANWTQLSGAERTQRTPLLLCCTCVLHAFCSYRDHLHFSLKWLLDSLTWLKRSSGKHTVVHLSLWCFCLSGSGVRTCR